MQEGECEGGGQTKGQVPDGERVVILTQQSHKESFREYLALLEVPKPSDSLPLVSNTLGQPLSQTHNQQPQVNQTSLSPTIIKSELENLKTNVENIVLGLRKDEDLVMDY